VFHQGALQPGTRTNPAPYTGSVCVLERESLCVWAGGWVCGYWSVFLSVCLSVCLSICVSVCLFVCLFVCVSICLSFCVCLCLCLCSAAGKSAREYMGVRLRLRLRVCVIYVCMWVCVSVCMWVCSVYEYVSPLSLASCSCILCCSRKQPMRLVFPGARDCVRAWSGHVFSVWGNKRRPEICVHLIVASWHYIGSGAVPDQLAGLGIRTGFWHFFLQNPGISGISLTVGFDIFLQKVLFFKSF